MKTLPDTIIYKNEETGEIITRPTSDMITQAIKSNKAKELKDDEGNVKMTDREVVKNILLQNFRTKEGESYELPDEMQQYSKLNDFCAAIVDSYREAEKSLKGAKEAEKEQKAQERQAEKEKKEAEDKEYKAAGDEFEELMLRKAEKLKSKQEDRVKAMLQTVSAVLPKSIVLSGNGLGLVLSENASRADIAAATAGVVDALEGVANMQGALQFALGDIINGAVKSDAYRTKGDACQAIKLVVKDKLKKNFNIGTLNYYATMAERVSLENRKTGVNPSLYLEASKLTLPRNKEAKPSDAIALEKEVVEARNNIIEKINSGEVKNIKEAKAQIDEFKASKGFGKKEVTPVSVYQKALFFAVWIKKYLLGDKDEVEVQIDAKNTKVYTRAELTDIEEDAMNNLQNMLIKQSVPNLMAGFMEKGKGDKKEQIPYLIDNPFGVAVDADVQQMASEPVEKIEEEEEEEEEE